MAPGLHQIACNRRIFGGLLLVLYIAADFTKSNIPYEISVGPFPTYALARNLSDILQHVSWLLVAIDLTNLETRKLRFNHFLVLSCAAGIYFAPFHNSGAMSIFVEQGNNACPAFCKYDIVEWDFIDRRVDTLSKGDYVILDGFGKSSYTTKILAGPPEKACAGDSRTALRLPSDNNYCDFSYGSYDHDFLIRGRSKLSFQNIAGRNITMISRVRVKGVRPRKIGNTHEYFVFTDGITDIVGNALLVVYKWTGFNFFGFLDDNKTILETSMERKINSLERTK